MTAFFSFFNRSISCFSSSLFIAIKYNVFWECKDTTFSASNHNFLNFLFLLCLFFRGVNMVDKWGKGGEGDRRYEMQFTMFSTL